MFYGIDVELFLEFTTSCQNNHAQKLAHFFPYTMPWHNQPMCRVVFGAVDLSDDEKSIAKAAK